MITLLVFAYLFVFALMALVIGTMNHNYGMPSIQDIGLAAVWPIWVVLIVLAFLPVLTQEVWAKTKKND